MVEPRASVVIATYNYSTVLPYSIGSALDQSVADIEVLVVGDGCTDDSETVVASIGDERVRWVNLRERTGHQSGPNNRGIAEAKAPVIFYLGHDDLWMPRHVELLLDAMEAGADVAHGLTYRVEPDGMGAILPSAVRYGPGIPLPPTCFAHRVELAERHGDWTDYRDGGAMPEFDLISRFAKGGARVASVVRVTSIKLPAAIRRDVYKDRPFAEQRAWLDRIRTESDLEARIFAQAFENARMQLQPLPVAEDAVRVGKRIAGRLKRRLARFTTPEARIDRNKRFKGSD